jgi:glucose-1-phosphate adenylyltransferase
VIAPDTLALVLAGGNGTRLGELTRRQCKPAIPFGGHFRNIDFTLSNCVNSKIHRIAVLTQYKAQTLIDHITNGWNFLPRQLNQFVDVWPAQQRLHSSWYAGTADAVYQNLDLILSQRTKYTLVLAGDHIYKMDYLQLLQRHIEADADVTVGCLPVPVEQCSAFGVLSADTFGRVTSFVEKPPATALAGTQTTVLASMGIYAFRTDYLVDRLTADARNSNSSHDFGHDILPAAVREDSVSAYRFTDGRGRPGYWRDVGTLDGYWQAHMELLQENPPVDLYDPAWPILTLPDQLPPARLVYDNVRHGYVANSMLSGGTVVRNATVTNSVLGPRVRVGEGTVLDQAVVLPGARIGAGCVLRRVIVDSETVVPDGTLLSGGEDAIPGSGDQVALLTRGSAEPEANLRSVA